MEILISIVALIIILVIIYKCSEILEKACSAIAYRFAIPASVAGATLLAVSSSAPEFFTSCIGAVFYHTFEIGLMTILWSAIFNILIIPGCSAVFSPTPLYVSKKVVTRDGVVYLIATLQLILLVCDGHFTRWDALLLLVSYVSYIYVLYLSLGRVREKRERIKRVKMSTWQMYLFLIIGILIIGMACHYMIHFGKKLVIALDLSMALISATVFAWGTSLPDLFLSIFAARDGNGSAAVSNAFGSNSFDICVCLSVPILVVGDIPIEIGHSLPSVLMLLFSVIFTLLLIRIGWRLTKLDGWILLIIFVICVTIFLWSLPGGSQAKYAGPIQVPG